MRHDKEINHHSHPKHTLKIEYTENPFTCDGCKETGIGIKYKCDLCNFDLHKVCALAPQTLSQAFYPECEFRFHDRPPGQAARICDACQKDVLGFVYHCKWCGFDLHPCCANLPQTLNDGEHNLYPCRKLSSSCLHCGGKGKGWAYRSEKNNYNLHVSCVKELLVESWQANNLNVDKNKVREIQTRIPRIRGGNNQRARGGKARKYVQIAGGAIRVIVGAILGDPTAIIAAVVVGLMTK